MTSVWLDRPPIPTDQGHEYSEKTGRAMAANLVGVARALAERPLGPPPE